MSQFNGSLSGQKVSTIGHWVGMGKVGHQVFACRHVVGSKVVHKVGSVHAVGAASHIVGIPGGHSVASSGQTVSSIGHSVGVGISEHQVGFRGQMVKTPADASGHTVASAGQTVGAVDAQNVTPGSHCVGIPVSQKVNSPGQVVGRSIGHRVGISGQ